MVNPLAKKTEKNWDSPTKVINAFMVKLGLIKITLIRVDAPHVVQKDVGFPGSWTKFLRNGKATESCRP